MRRPRPFSLRPIYTDPRRDRLAEVERRARRELGLDHDEPSAADLRGVFSRGQRHVLRRREKGRGLSTQKLVLLIVVLLLIWKLLL